MTIIISSGHFLDIIQCFSATPLASKQLKQVVKEE